MKHWVSESSASERLPDINEHRLMRHLREVLARIEMPNRTPAAEAMHTALVADLRTAGLASDALKALTEEQIVFAYGDVSWALQSGNALAFELPFGTTAISSVKGTLQIGVQTYVLDAGRPGLHAMETVRRDAHGPNLEMLVASIARKTRRLACRKLGAPVPVHVVEADSRYYLQFAPLREAGDVVLQRDVFESGADRFCAALPGQIEEFARSIVADMRALWKRRKEIRTRVDEVRAAAEAGLRGDAGLGDQHTVKAIAVDMSMVADYPVSLYVEYLTLDEALRMGTVIDFVPANYSLEDRVWPAPRALSFRSGFRDRLAALGASGLIDKIAEAVARAAPGGIAPILARLTTSYETGAVLPSPTGPLYATLFWRDGVIQAELSMPRRLDWYSGRLELEGFTLPETILASLPGRTLASVVELPFESTAQIKDVDEAGTDRIRLQIDPEEKLVNLSTGAVWEHAGDNFALYFG